MSPARSDPDRHWPAGWRTVASLHRRRSGACSSKRRGPEPRPPWPRPSRRRSSYPSPIADDPEAAETLSRLDPRDGALRACDRPGPRRRSARGRQRAADSPTTLPFEQLIARGVVDAAVLRTLHSTVLVRAQALKDERNIIAELPAGDPVDNATVLLVGPRTPSCDLERRGGRNGWGSSGAPQRRHRRALSRGARGRRLC